MTLKSRLLNFSNTLALKGLHEEAEIIKRVAHCIPDNGTGLPSFWRRNYDYGEGFYYGNMAEKPSVPQWLKRKKKKKTKASDIVFLLKRASGDPELRRLYEEEARLRSQLDDLTKQYGVDIKDIVELQKKLDTIQDDILERTFSTGKPQTDSEEELVGEIDRIREQIEEAKRDNDLVLVKSLEDVLSLLEGNVEQVRKERQSSMIDDLVGQAQRLVDPESLVDYFRIALLNNDYDEAKRLYEFMLPREKEEATEIAQHYYRAVRVNKMLHKEGQKRILSFVSPTVKTAVTFRKQVSPEGVEFVVVFTNHFEREAYMQGSDFDMRCMQSKFGEMFDSITTLPDVWGSRFGRSFVYYTKKYNNRPERKRWELELHSCTPDRRFHTQNRQGTKYLDIGC